MREPKDTVIKTPTDITNALTETVTERWWKLCSGCGQMYIEHGLRADGTLDCTRSEGKFNVKLHYVPHLIELAQYFAEKLVADRDDTIKVLKDKIAADAQTYANTLAAERTAHGDEIAEKDKTIRDLRGSVNAADTEAQATEQARAKLEREHEHLLDQYGTLEDKERKLRVAASKLLLEYRKLKEVTLSELQAQHAELQALHEAAVEDLAVKTETLEWTTVQFARVARMNEVLLNQVPGQPTIALAPTASAPQPGVVLLTRPKRASQPPATPPVPPTNSRKVVVPPPPPPPANGAQSAADALAATLGLAAAGASAPATVAPAPTTAPATAGVPTAAKDDDVTKPVPRTDPAAAAPSPPKKVPVTADAKCACDAGATHAGSLARKDGNTMTSYWCGNQVCLQNFWRTNAVKLQIADIAELQNSFTPVP